MERVERAPSSTSRLAFLRRTLDRKNPISGSRVLDTGPRGGGRDRDLNLRPERWGAKVGLCQSAEDAVFECVSSGEVSYVCRSEVYRANCLLDFWGSKLKIDAWLG